MFECKPVDPYTDEDVVRIAQSLTEEQWGLLDDVYLGDYILVERIYDTLSDMGLVWVGRHEYPSITRLGRRVYTWRDVFYGTK